jgi:putative tributyrin esterase
LEPYTQEERDIGPDDLFALAEQIDRRVLPALHIDCGTEDGLLDRNRRFHAHLDTLGIPHQYEEFPDGHSWDYWDRHVQKALAFHAGVLGTSSAS